ncbi:MAG TPA: cysteine--tRNA ligase, partial [Allocoleopsis sp.]
IKRLIHDLEVKGFAYPSSGDVYYSVGDFSDYGKLSGRNLADMQAGASGRVEVEDPDLAKKKHPFDFALWKGVKPGEPYWESDWGNGRPGWHIECSAMVRDRLGETIDIHAGGADLIFPHHENEIAQSEAATGKSLANYWLHNGMVTVNGEKMSKSLGNFITIRELLNRPTEPMAIRLFVLTAQYRKPIDFTDEAIAAATNGWHTLKSGLLFGKKYGEKLGWNNMFSPHPLTPSPTGDGEKFVSGNESNLYKLEEINNDYTEKFKEIVDDDLNFPGGLAILFEIAKELNTQGNILTHSGKVEKSDLELKEMWITLVKLGEVLGFVADTSTTLSTRETEEQKSGLSEEEINRLIEQRLTARKEKNWAESDRIRDELKAQGVTLIDTKEGTRFI